MSVVVKAEGEQGQSREIDLAGVIATSFQTKQPNRLDHQKPFQHQQITPTPTKTQNQKTKPAPNNLSKTMSSDQQNPSLIGGHAQYVKGAAEVRLILIPVVLPPSQTNPTASPQ